MAKRSRRSALQLLDRRVAIARRRRASLDALWLLAMTIHRDAAAAKSASGGSARRTLIPRSAKARATESRGVRFEDHALKAFGPADSERGAGFELFVQDRGGDAAGIAQKRPFDLGVLRIKRGDSLEGIERADAEEGELRTQRLDVGQSPASDSRADLAADATSNQPKRDLRLSQQGRGDRRIMRRRREPKIVGKSLHRREVCRARIDEEQRVRERQGRPTPGPAPPCDRSPRRRGFEPSSKPARPAARRHRRGGKGRARRDREDRGGSCPPRWRRPRRAQPPAPVRRGRVARGSVAVFRRQEST